MTVALTVSIVANVALAALYYRHLRELDARERRERSLMLTRIQDPPAAVAQAIATETEARSPADLYVGFDDDQAFHDAMRET